jgi:hypothetical protein
MTLLTTLESTADQLPPAIRDDVLRLCEWARDAAQLCGEVEGSELVSRGIAEEAERLLEEIEDQ